MSNWKLIARELHAAGRPMRWEDLGGYSRQDMLERLSLHGNSIAPSEMHLACKEAATAIDAALHEAIAAIYFDDGSDFRPALLRIVSILGGSSCLKLLEENPRACYAASAA